MSSKRGYTDPLIGQRVVVTGPGHYGCKCLHQTGVIRAVWNKGSIGVEVDGLLNRSSSYGYFYFKLSELSFINENNEMATAEEKENKTMSKITNYLNIATVNFLNDPAGLHTIECANYDASLKEGDLCVVKTARHGLGLAQVVKTEAVNRDNIEREIVTRVDTEAFDARVTQREKAAELKAKMQERAKQLQDIVLFQTLAKEDPEMAQMLSDYLALN